MHTQTYAPPRGGAAVLAIAIHGILIYGLAIGLGVVPTPLPIQAITVVDLPTEIREPVEPIDPRPIDFGGVTIPRPEVPDIVREDEANLPTVTPTDTGGVVSLPPPTEPVFSQARILQSYEPPYPVGSVRNGEEGTVLVRITLSPSGRIESVSLDRSSGMARLDEAALKAVRAWRFAPATRGGQGVGTSVVVPVKFELRR